MRAILESALSAQGRGSQTRLATAIDVKPQTVNKWIKGQTMPEMWRWPAIEEALGLDEGTIMAAAGITPHPADVGLRIPDEVRVALSVLGDELRQLRSEVAELRDEIRGPVRSSDPVPPTRQPTADRMKS